MRWGAGTWHAALGIRSFGVVSTAAATSTLFIATRAVGLVGAAPVQEGSWPTVVLLDRGCTGVLVGTHEVLTAGHCATGVTAASFDPPRAKRMRVLRCTAHPEATPGGALDLAVCELAESAPVSPFALRPACAGSRENAIPGSEVVVVGYGETTAASGGIKRELRTVIARSSPRLVIGGSGGSICAGDSGAPAFVRVASSAGVWVEPRSRSAYLDAPTLAIGVGSGGDAWEEWRLLGIASATASPFCDGSPGIFAVPEDAHAWLQTFPGLAAVPCAESSTRVDGRGAVARHSEAGGGSRGLLLLLLVLAGVGVVSYARRRRG